MTNLPASIEPLIDTLAAMPGVVAVVLGGSRAEGSAHEGSDWDLGVYYRGGIDTAKLAPFGAVHPPGSWGRVMNGGAWLSIDGRKVDVLFRDLSALDHWFERARIGEFEVDALLGYLAGAPTYLLVAERAVCLPLRGALPATEPYPPKLAESAASRWRFCAEFTLDYARMHARRGDALGTAGQVAKAVMEESHARMAHARRWVLNEKRLAESAGLGDVRRSFGAIPGSAEALVAWVDGIASALKTR